MFKNEIKCNMYSFLCNNKKFLTPKQIFFSIKAEKNEEPKLGSVSEQVSRPVKKEEKEDDLAYPFGGWTDEENYR